MQSIWRKINVFCTMVKKVLSPSYSLKWRGKQIIYLHALACECCFFRFSSCIYACWNFKIVIQLLRSVENAFFLNQNSTPIPSTFGWKNKRIFQMFECFSETLSRISVKIARIVYFGVGYNVDIANMLIICFECSKR